MVQQTVSTLHDEMAAMASPSRVPDEAGSFEIELAMFGKRFDQLLHLTDSDRAGIVARIRTQLTPILREAAALDQHAAQAVIEA